MVKLLGAFDNCKSNRLQSAFTGLHPSDGTNPQMALICRWSSRKLPARFQRVRCKLGAAIIVSSDQRNLVFSSCPEVADPQSAIGQLENYPCRSPGPGAGAGSGQGQGGARAQGDGDGQGPVRADAVAGQSSQRFLAGIVFGGLSPGALSWQCLPGRCQFPGAHGMVRGIPCAGSTFPGTGLLNRVCHCWGGHCWAGLPSAGPPLAELAQVSVDPVVNRTVPMGLASVH